MPSSALSGHLEQLLADAEDLDDAHDRLKTGRPGRQYGLAALNRATVLMCVSAWEAYVEELVRESLTALRPLAPPLGLWPALYASARSQLGRFNTPNAEQVRILISDSIGLQDVRLSWVWRNCTPTQAAHRLGDAMELRHRIVHGVNPRPVVQNSYSHAMPDFFRRLADCTDNAVREYLMNTLGIADPCPA